MPNKMGRIYQYKNINIIDPAQPGAADDTCRSG